MSKGAGENKVEHKAENKPSDAGASKSKGPNQVAGACSCWGCKKDAKRYSFCDEHYDHFKFGLIKKTGEPVMDYDKKLGHYLAHKAKKGSQKIA